MPTETARYYYLDGEGTAKYVKIKYLEAGKKTFKYAQIKDGVEVFGMDGVTRIPYAFTKVLDAFEEGEPLYYVEGEKDADALNRLGFYATTFGGANDLKASLKNNSDLPNYFKDIRKLIIIPDNDGPGRKLAADVFTAFKGCFPEGIRVLELPDIPEKGDVSDWLELCGDNKKEKFQAVAENSKDFTEELVTKWRGDVKPPPVPSYTQDLVSKFHGLRNQLRCIKVSGENKFNAQCPVHSDDSPSLTVTLTGDRILLHCHAGCSTDSILHSLGLKIGDLFAGESRPSAEAIAVAKEAIIRQIPESINEMSFEKLPQVIQDYVREASGITSGSVTSTAIAMVTIIGGYLGLNCRFPGYFGHTLYPNIWALSIASSGSFKSTMVKIAAKKMRLDDSVHLSAIKEMQKAQEEFKPGSEDWNDLDAAIKGEQGQTLQMPERISLEALFQEFRYRNKGVWLPDEFSSWLKMATASYNEGLKNMLTELYDPDQSIKKVTKSGGLEVMENAFVSICSTSTIEFVVGGKERLIGPEDAKTGFFARFLLFRVPDLENTPPALPMETKLIEQTDAYHKFSQLCDRFKNISDPINMRFSEEAREHFNGWHNGIWDLKGIKESEPYLYDLLRSYASRWSPACIKLSMILQQCLTPGDEIITSRALTGAISILDFVIQSTKMLFRRELGETYVEGNRRKLLEYIAKNENLTWRKLIQSRCLKGATTKKYDEVVEELIQAGKLVKVDGIKKAETKILLA
tara:strand:- start:2803 stop:5037 length:2235 start_codon:yes stop_codon:yes gene_type:complete